MKKKNAYPVITVIVPIYNVAPYLHNCINSILDSTYTNLEVILVNDGSTDNSGKICDEYQEKDQRCKVIHQINAGISAARNSGLKEATGKYISFIDGDDYMSPFMIETLYRSIIKDDFQFSMILGKQVYDYTCPTRNRDNKEPNIQILNQNDLFQMIYGKGTAMQYLVVWNKLYKTEVIKNLYFEKTGSEDMEFNNRVYLRTTKAIIIKEYLYFWLQRPTSITHQPFNENFIDRINSYTICLQTIPTKEYFPKALCLEKLYKTILHTRYLARNTSYYKKTINLARRTNKKHFSNFIRNEYIDFKLKIIITFFYFIPFAYTIYREFMEFKAKQNFH